MTVRGSARLERSCTANRRDWIMVSPDRGGVERLEAFFAGHGYDPHRHDTYAIGLTLYGVQSFGYRRTTEHSRRGQAIVLHPDELHDGRAGTDAGFRYRMMYIEPHLVQEALGGARRPLPFMHKAVTSDVRLINAVAPALEDLDHPLEDLQLDQNILAISGALAALDRSTIRDFHPTPDARAVATVCDFLNANVEKAISSKQLETITGLSRFALARHFRACVGTSPYRYLVMRRLDRARRLVLAGEPLSFAALASGFADQSHMTRQFKRAYGISPGRLQRIAARP